MKVLIGTPIHQLKDYSIERWLKNVAELQNATPADVLLVDNSQSKDYVEKVKKYCKKYKIKKYRVKHFELTHNNLDSHKKQSQRIEVAQEIIRRETLKGGYDAWFSWECDQIIPTNSLKQLIALMKIGNYMMVVANSWARTIPSEFNTNMGVTLISKKALKKSWFLPTKNGEISLDVSDSYNIDQMMFKKRILQSGGNYIEVYGVIKPVYHLDK